MRRILVFASLLLLAACSSDAPPPESGSARRRIAGIVFQEDQFFRSVELGMRAAAERGGADLLTGNSFGALDKEVALIDSYLAGKVDAIVVSPLSRTGSAPALDRAAAAGIRVVTYNTGVDGGAPACSIESDQKDLGAQTGRAVREHVEATLGGKAEIAIIAYMSQAPEQCSLRVVGFKEALAALPGVRIVAEQDAWLVQQATDVVEQLLTAHPDLDVVWAANEGGTVGAAVAVRNAGKAGRVAVFGTDISEQLARLLLADDGVLRAVTGQKPFEMGSLAVTAALDVLEGKPVARSSALPGVLFTRARPEEVAAYLDALGTQSR